MKSYLHRHLKNTTRTSWQGHKTVVWVTVMLWLARNKRATTCGSTPRASVKTSWPTMWKICSIRVEWVKMMKSCDGSVVLPMPLFVCNICVWVHMAGYQRNLYFSIFKDRFRWLIYCDYLCTTNTASSYDINILEHIWDSSLCRCLYLIEVVFIFQPWSPHRLQI